MSAIRLDVVTAEGMVYSDDVDVVVAPGVEGQLGILPHHAPLMTILQPGELRARKGGEELYLAITGGFLEVRPFGTTELDKTTRAQLERGQRLTEILKQPQYVPVSVEKQVMILYAAVNGYLDDIAIDKLAAFETNFYRFTEANHPQVGKSIATEKEITAETEEALKAAIEEFKQGMTF